MMRETIKDTHFYKSYYFNFEDEFVMKLRQFQFLAKRCQAHELIMQILQSKTYGKYLRIIIKLTYKSCSFLWTELFVDSHCLSSKLHFRR